MPTPGATAGSEDPSFRLPTSLSLRSARPADAQALFDLGHALLVETDHFIRVPEERAADTADMAAIIERYTRQPGWAMLTVWEGALAVAEGVLAAGTLTRGAHVASLGIGVRRAYWGQGIGRALMAALEARARDFALERIEFTVFAHNRRARDFYRRLGYDEEGVRRRSVRYAPQTPGAAPRYADEVMMAKWIGPELEWGAASPEAEE